MQHETPSPTYTDRLDANGWIVIPARVREALGLTAGSDRLLLNIPVVLIR